MDIKKKLDITKQKITGVAQQVKGDLEVKTGHRVQGTIDKVKGKANVIGADLRNKLEDSK